MIYAHNGLRAVRPFPGHSPCPLQQNSLYTSDCSAIAYAISLSWALIKARARYEGIRRAATLFDMRIPRRRVKVRSSATKPRLGYSTTLGCCKTYRSNKKMHGIVRAPKHPSGLLRPPRLQYRHPLGRAVTGLGGCGC